MPPLTSWVKYAEGGIANFKLLGASNREIGLTAMVSTAQKEQE